MPAATALPVDHAHKDKARPKAEGKDHPAYGSFKKPQHIFYKVDGSGRPVGLGEETVDHYSDILVSLVLLVIVLAIILMVMFFYKKYRTLNVMDVHRRVQRATYEYSQLSQCEGGAAEPPAANDELGLAMPSTDEEDLEPACPATISVTSSYASPHAAIINNNNNNDVDKKADSAAAKPAPAEGEKGSGGGLFGGVSLLDKDVDIIYPNPVALPVTLPVALPVVQPVALETPASPISPASPPGPIHSPVPLLPSMPPPLQPVPTAGSAASADGADPRPRTRHSLFADSDEELLQ